jgi:PAS domain S-box-containing protein
LSNQEYAGLLEKAPFLTSVFDISGKITFANEYLCEITGFTKEEILGENWYTKFLTTESLWKMAQLCIRSQNHDQDYGLFKGELLTKSGAKRDVNFLSISLRNCFGEVVSIANIGECFDTDVCP